MHTPVRLSIVDGRRIGMQGREVDEALPEDTQDDEVTRNDFIVLRDLRYPGRLGQVTPLESENLEDDGAPNHAKDIVVRNIIGSGEGAPRSWTGPSSLGLPRLRSQGSEVPIPQEHNTQPPLPKPFSFLGWHVQQHHSV